MLRNLRHLMLAFFLVLTFVWARNSSCAEFDIFEQKAEEGSQVDQGRAPREREPAGDPEPRASASSIQEPRRSNSAPPRLRYSDQIRGPEPQPDVPQPEEQEQDARLDAERESGAGGRRSPPIDIPRDSPSPDFRDFNPEQSTASRPFSPHHPYDAHWYEPLPYGGGEGAGAEERTPAPAYTNYDNFEFEDQGQESDDGGDLSDEFPFPFLMDEEPKN